jgi:phosphate transport system permease protein
VKATMSDTSTATSPSTGRVGTPASWALPPRRRATDLLARLGLLSALALALIPLAAVLIYVVKHGLPALNLGFLTHSMKGVGALDTTGGAYHAILGTVEQVGIAIVLAVPLGIAVAIYLTEIGPTTRAHRRLAAWIRFFVDVMTGLPSIVAGLFIFAFWVLALHQGFSGLAAGLALAVLMLPVVVRTCEEMLALVPRDLREAAWALGAPRWRTVWRVVLPAAGSGITTGLMLAVARVTGETAPLLLTAFGYDAIRTSPVAGPQAGLPMFVYDQSGSAFAPAIERAWAGALTLIGLVIGLTVLARLLARRFRPLEGL